MNFFRIAFIIWIVSGKTYIIFYEVPSCHISQWIGYKKSIIIGRLFIRSIVYFTFHQYEYTVQVVQSVFGKV